MLQPWACSLHAQRWHCSLELPHTRQGWSKPLGSGFTSHCKQVFLQFSIWTATLLILPGNRGGGLTLRGSRRLPPVSICVCWGAPGAEVLRGAKPAPLSRAAGASHAELWLMLNPSSVRCPAPPSATDSEHLSSAGLHSSLGNVEWVLWDMNFPSVFNLLTDMLLPVNRSCFRKWVTSFAS